MKPPSFSKTQYYNAHGGYFACLGAPTSEYCHCAPGISGGERGHWNSLVAIVPFVSPGADVCML